MQSFLAKKPQQPTFKTQLFFLSYAITEHKMLSKQIKMEYFLSYTITSLTLTSLCTFLLPISQIHIKQIMF